MRLTDDVIEDIRNSANIVDVIGHYIPLVKKGKGYSALCPFHDDHDPSLSISEDKQIYKCFVCGNGGNCFSFVQNFKKITFPESVVEVSKIIGKPIEIDLGPKKVSKNQKYYDVLSSMISYGKYLLSGSKLGEKPMEYLMSRGLDKDLIEHFDIGYNPENDVMYEYLKKHGFKDEEMIKSGVCRMLDRGMSDVFYRRIFFPIHDKDGNPIAFTARDYLGTSDSKYINSSDNIIYTKGDNLYNYHRAKTMAQKSGYVIVCEGVMDVIAFYRADKENVVATLGTACTKKQIELLKTLSKHVVLSYDGDKAGQSANLKIGEMLLNEGFEVSVIDNKTGLDPDEIINRYDKNALRDLESKQITYMDYVLNHYQSIYNLDNYNDRKKMTMIVSGLIEKLPDEYDRENYANALFELTKIRKRTANVGEKMVYNTKDVSRSFTVDGLTKAEYTILAMISQSRKALTIYQKELGCLLDDDNQQLSMLITDDYRKNEKCSLSRIYDECGDDDIRNLIGNLAVIDGLPEEFDEIVLDDAIAKVKLEIQKKKIEELRKLISKTSTVDPAASVKYMEEYTQLIKEVGGKYGKAS